MAALQTTGTPTQVTPPPTATPSVPKPLTTQQPAPLGVSSATPSTTSPAPTTPWAPGVSTYSTTPSSDLRGQTITPGPMANREQIANTYEQNWNAQTDPQFQADLKSATSQAAGAGQLGSGQLRTSLGDLAYNRDVQRNADESNFQNTALNGTIQDAYNNIGIAQQQQGFQSGEQNQTFNQGLQSLLAGQSGNPADTQLALSQLYGNNAAQSSQGLNGLIGGSINNTAQQSALQQLLRGLGGGTSTATPTPAPVGTPIYNTGYNGVTG